VLWVLSGKKKRWLGDKKNTALRHGPITVGPITVICYYRLTDIMFFDRLTVVLTLVLPDICSIFLHISKVWKQRALFIKPISALALISSGWLKHHKVAGFCKLPPSPLAMNLKPRELSPDPYCCYQLSFEFIPIELSSVKLYCCVFIRQVLYNSNKLFGVINPHS